MAASRRDEAANSATPQKQWRASGVQRARPKILLVESNRWALAALCELFAESAYSVVPVRSRSEALEAARQSRSIQLLLAETRPADEGDELLHTFRTLHPSAGIILMSALTEHGLDPVVEVVAKPIHFEPLLALIDDLLARQSH